MKRRFNKYSLPGLSLTLGLVLVTSLYFSTSLRELALKGLDLISAVLPSTLVEMANKDRVEANLATLQVSPLLEKAANLKAQDMAHKGYFAHNTPDGKTPWYWFAEAGYNYKYAGENLAVNFLESADVEKAWMASPTHRLNILNPKYTEVGIATSTGVYKGKQAIFVVQMFGSPK